MLRAATFTLLRLRTPLLGGGGGGVVVRRLCSSQAANPDGYFHSETEARELFEIWCKKYHKTYSSEDEQLLRFGRFKESLEWSTRENQKQKQHDNPAHGYFSTYDNADQTEEEFLKRYGGWIWS